MPILNQIRAVVNTLTGSPSFIYGTADEVNILLEDVTKWPVVGLQAETKVNLNFGVSHAIGDKFPVFIYFLFKDEEQSEFSKDQEGLVKQAIDLCKEFLIKLNEYRCPIDEAGHEGRYFKIKTTDKVQLVPLYKAFDAYTAGGYITMDLTTMYADNVSL